MSFGLSATTVAWIAVGTAVASAGVAAYGQYQAGKAAKDLADYNAKQEEINAAAAARDANIQANQMRARNRGIEGHLYAQLAASGVATDTGSPLLDEVNTHANLEMSALEAEREGGIEAGRLLQQSELDRIEGKNALTSAKISAGATILQGTSNALVASGGTKKGKAPKTG